MTIGPALSLPMSQNHCQPVAIFQGDAQWALCLGGARLADSADQKRHDDVEKKIPATATQM